jgi:hypothetical protein
MELSTLVASYLTMKAMALLYGPQTRTLTCAGLDTLKLVSTLRCCRSTETMFVNSGASSSANSMGYDGTRHGRNDDGLQMIR